MTDNQFLTPHQLVERWGGRVSVQTLANWRASNKGPRFVKLGARVTYRISDVEEYETQQTVQTTGGAAGEAAE
jgi:hypothetical protein